MSMFLSLFNGLINSNQQVPTLKQSSKHESTSSLPKVLPMEISSAEAKLKYIFLDQPTKTRQGNLWKALDTTNNRHVAVKEASRRYVDNQKNVYGDCVLEDFIHECIILSTLNSYSDCHKGIVKIYHTWKTKKSYFMAFEWCNGGNIYSRLPTGKKQNRFFKSSRSSHHSEFAGSISCQIAHILAYLHDKEIIHGDLSLDNIMFTKKHSKEIRIIDFGLSHDDHSPVHQSSGKIIYMSPECYDGKIYDGKKNDVWCFGVLLYILLFGINPYEKPSKNDFKFEMIQKGKLRYILQNDHIIHLAPSSAIDLLEKIFRPEKERLDMKQILKHPFILEMLRKYDVIFH